VTSGEAVTGPYNVIALVEARNLDELGRLVVGKVQAIEGVALPQRTGPPGPRLRA
jgi:DNA-binding Lrp family transcriptional regulator